MPYPRLAYPYRFLLPKKIYGNTFQLTLTVKALASIILYVHSVDAPAFRVPL